MKRISSSMSLLLLMAPSSTLAADPYEVMVRRDSDTTFALDVTASETTSHSCVLKATQLYVKTPPGPGIRDNRGRIRIEVDIDSDQDCRKTFGHHKGTITLQRGTHLPAVPDGIYRLAIGRHEIGDLELGQGVLLMPPAADETPTPKREG